MEIDKDLLTDLALVHKEFPVGRNYTAEEVAFMLGQKEIEMALNFEKVYNEVNAIKFDPDLSKQEIIDEIQAEYFDVIDQY